MKALRTLPAVFVLSAFLFAPIAQAAIITAATGTAEVSTPRVNFWFKLASNISADDLNYIYVTIHDSAASGYLTNIQLHECDDENYNTPSGCNGVNEMRQAVTALGGTTNYSVSLAGTGKRTVKLDFTYHTIPGCTPGVNCTGSTADIVLNPAKFYYLYFEFDTQVNAAGTNLSRSIYGISNTITDVDGNPILCAFTQAWTTGCVEISDFTDVHTPYFVLTDSELSNVEMPAWGFVDPASSSSGLNLSGAEEVCEGIFNTASNSFGYRDFFKWACVMQGWLYIPSADAFDSFDAPIALAKERLPFSYAYELKTIYDNASTASGSFPTVSVPYDQGDAWGQVASSSFVLFSIATIKTYITDDILGTIRDLLSAVVWVWVAGTIWRRTKGIIGQT